MVRLFSILAIGSMVVAQQPARDSAPVDATVDAPVDATVTDARWLSRPLSELAGSRGTVLWFATIDCPLVRRYLPRVQTLAAEYGERGVRFLFVNAGAGDGLVEAAAQQVEHVPQATFVKDFDGALAAAAGVDRTATAVLLDAARTVVYRGRVDGQYRYTGAAPEVGREDLRQALDDLLAGRAVAMPSTAVEGCRIAPPAAPPAVAPAPTFARDVLLLLQQNCQECHRPGGEAPFALLTHADARANLAMIGEVVEQQRMPPWYGSRRHGAFANERTLAPAARAAIAAWVAAGGPEGDPADAPPPRPWPEARWRIGEPDLVLRVPVPIRLPADGWVPYKYFVLPYHFAHDTWVEAIEIRPGNKRALHHCNMARVQWGAPFSQDGFVTGQVPGGDAMVLDPGTAVRIPKGSALVLQAHYVTTGEEVTDRLEVGLRFPRVVVDRELQVCIANNNRFRIPPFASAHPVRGARTLAQAARGIGLFVHMHVRGRDMTVRATAPGGEPETLLLVPNYNFDWQQSYRWPREGKLFAAGTRIEALAHFDNSTGNPFNPDPERTVGFGLDTRDEMMYAFLFYTHEGERLQLRVDAATGRVVE